MDLTLAVYWKSAITSAIYLYLLAIRRAEYEGTCVELDVTGVWQRSFPLYSQAGS